MADSYAHQYNARAALKIANYTPRVLEAFILGCNGPDPLFFYQMQNPFRKYNLNSLGTHMHNNKTGLFLQNLFRLAKTDAQKDYCLGFLCHYSLDTIIHPYINYITNTYGMPYNIPSGHGYFESALDSQLSFKETGNFTADVNSYCPELKSMHLQQIVTLLKNTVDITYPTYIYSRKEYLLAFKDFKYIKTLFEKPMLLKKATGYTAEKLLKFNSGYIISHFQPCNMPINTIPMWINEANGLFSTASIWDLLDRANYLSADYINIGLEFFKGIYSSGDLLEDIGNKSYETGVVI